MGKVPAVRIINKLDQPQTLRPRSKNSEDGQEDSIQWPLPVLFLQLRRILSTHFYNQSSPFESLGQIVLLVFSMPPARFNLSFLSASPATVHVPHFCVQPWLYRGCADKEGIHTKPRVLGLKATDCFHQSDVISFRKLCLTSDVWAYYSFFCFSGT